MQIIIRTQHLRSATKTAAKLIGKESIRPILVNVLLHASSNNLEITATNQAETAEVTLKAKVLSPGACTVSARMLADIAAVLTGNDTTLLLEENGLLTITSGESRFQLPTIPATEYPALEKDFKPLWSEKYAGDVLRGYLNKILFVEGDESLKAAYKAVLFESNGLTESKVFLACTDSKRLTVLTTEATAKINKSQWLVPQAFLRKVADLCSENEVLLSFSNTQLRASGESTTLTGRLFEDSFPNWRGIMPTSYSKKWTLPKDILSSAIKSLSPIAKEQDNIIRMVFSASGVSLTATSQCHGNASIKIQSMGNLSWPSDDFEVGCNSKFLLQAMAASESEIITLEANTPTMPMLLTGNQDVGWNYIIMPVLLD